MAHPEIRTNRLGEFTAGAPAYTGKLNCKCVIFPDCPFFDRKLQDEHYVLSPNTIDKAPPQLREKVEAIPGVDGIYLQPNYVYRHNFVSALIPTESTDDNEKNQSRQLEEDTNIVPADRLEFVGLANESLVTSFFKTFVDSDGLVRLTQPLQTIGAESAHHTWIQDGSLYINYSYTESQLQQPPKDDVDDFKRLYYPHWEYYLHNAPPETQSVGGVDVTKKQDNFKHVPYQSKTSIYGDPIVFLDDLSSVDSFEFRTNKNNVYKNVNPGVHWRVLKRTPMFQGEDFWVEFHKKALETDISISKSSKFQVRKGYEFLDPYQQPTPGSNVPNANEAIVGVGLDGAKIEEALKTYDLSDQSYIIVEIGYLHPQHNYFLIIAERDYPILCHAGRPFIRVPDPASQSGGSTSQAPPANSASGEDDCGGEATPSSNSDASSGQTGGSTTKVVAAMNTVLRRLGRFTSVSSRRLLQQDKLRVTFRQHLGKLVITFSGYEKEPWVITRTDLLPLPTASDLPESEEDFATEDVPIIIPKSQIALMGGNIKTAFSFGTLLYKRLDLASLNQRLSIAGPVDFKEINLLLRDKGISKDPGVSTRSHDYEFSQEAEEYEEFIDGKFKKTLAIEVQEQSVLRYGKAPDMQALPNSAKRDRASMWVYARDCTRRVGSELPTSKVIETAISMWPGDYIFTAGIASDGGLPWTLKGCITPIMTGFRLNVPPAGEAFASPALDVSHHVMKISDSWTEDDLTRIQHSGRIQFLVNRGMHNFFSDGRRNFAEYLRSLSDKNFYVQISVWWDDEGAIPTPRNDAGRVIFTGIATNASINEETNFHTMTCDLFDYTKVLQEQVFLNSPFYDKMRDFNAVYDIVQMAGFRDETRLQPGSLMKRLAETDVSGWFQLPHNGETVYNQEYALPGSYNILFEPMFKFRDGSTYYEAIQKMSQIAGKVIYFDRLGVFHYEKLPYDQALFNGQQGSSSNLTIADWERLSKIDFFTSAHDVSAFDAKEQHRMVWDSYTVSRDMDSVINHINIISNTPDGKLLLGGLLNFDSIKDIEKPGFIGYPKTLLQMEGIIGDKANVQWLIKHYTKMFLPPIKVRFKAIGHNNLKALDIVTFRGLGWRNKQVLIIGSVSSEIDAENNQWWQEFECYWIFPSVNLSLEDINVISIGEDDLLQGTG